MNDDISNEITLDILKHEREMWMNSRQLLTIRYRVNKRLGNTEAIKAIEAELEKCEMALDELDKIGREVNPEPASL